MSQKTYGMNSDDVKRDGGVLIDNAGEIKSEIKTLDKLNSDLRSIWKGASAESYFAKWEEKKASISKLQEWLNSYGEKIVKSAKKSEEADQETLDIIG